MSLKSWWRRAVRPAVPATSNDHTGKEGDGLVVYEAYFSHTAPPWDVKFTIEKASKILLAREAASDQTLIFAGSSASQAPRYRAVLSLEAASPERRLYRLRMEATYPRKFFTEEAMRRQYLDPAFKRWTEGLATTRSPTSLKGFSPALYSQLVAETLALEAERAGEREDPAPIAAARRAVAAAIREGKRCGGTDKEGQTTFFFDGENFIRDHVGDWDERLVFATDDEMLVDLRAFYDWAAKRGSYPHPPPEIDVWGFIQAKLR